MKTSDVRRMLLDKWVKHSDEAGMVELIGTSFIADEPTILRRPPNLDYIARELEWYISQSPFVKDIPGEVPTIWNRVADETGAVNSNYGRLVFHSTNFSQFNQVVAELRANPKSRRGTIVYTRPSIHDEVRHSNGDDFICTNAANYFIRDGAVHVVVQMRSNDAVFGYPNDVAWQRHVLEKLAGEVGAAPGKITWQAASLHVYPRHFDLLDELLQ